jgi:hypothetical protein
MTTLCINKGRGAGPYMRAQLLKLALENQMLMQRLGDVQAQCTQQFAALHQSLVLAQQQAMRLRAQQILQVTHLSWRLQQRFMSYAHTARQAGADTTVISWAQADAVICQTGCVSHQAYWLIGEVCLRSGEACTVAHLATGYDGGSSRPNQEGEDAMRAQALCMRANSR